MLVKGALGQMVLMLWHQFDVPMMVAIWDMFRHLLKRISSRQNGCCFADDIFICIFVNEKFCNLIKISLKFVPNGPIDNNPALV